MIRILFAGLFFLVAIFFPLLIWVALAVALKHWAREAAAQRGRTVAAILLAAGLPVQWAITGDASPEAAVFLKRPMLEISKLLDKAGL